MSLEIMRLLEIDKEKPSVCYPLYHLEGSSVYNVCQHDTSEYMGP